MHTDAPCLAVGPLNTAGQGYQWAEACSTYLGIAAFSYASSRRNAQRLDGPSHRRGLHHRVRPTFVKRIGAEVVLRRATHLLDESFATVTGDMRREDLCRDLGWLGKKGVDAGVVFHGSDVRSPSRHLDLEPASFFTLMDQPTIDRLEAATRATRRHARESGLPLFVSTPDLLRDVPEATWLPLVINATSWRPHEPALRGRPVRVLHVPSRRTPPIKGTSFIEPVMQRLHSRGLLEFVSPVRVPHTAMPDLVRSVDVVIDQLLTGSYGVAAIEALSAGRLVVGNVAADVRARLPRELPIVDCVPGELESLMAAIADDPGAYADVAARGPSYVEAVHTGPTSAHVLEGWLRAGQHTR